MSMNVNQDYSQFYVGTEQLKSYGSNSAVKKDTLVKYQFNTTDKDGNKVKANTQASSKDKVQEYYEKLCKKFSQININTGRSIASGGKNNIVLNLSNDCLKKMASDPDFAKKIENDIAGIPAAHEQMFAKAKSDGIEIHGFAVRINADGSMQCSCSGSTRTSGYPKR